MQTVVIESFNLIHMMDELIPENRLHIQTKEYSQDKWLDPAHFLWPSYVLISLLANFVLAEVLLAELLCTCKF